MNCSDNLIMWDFFRYKLDLGRDKTIERTRCDNIQDALKKNSIASCVSRHHVFDVNYYLIEVHTDECDDYVGSKEIADALGIDRDDVSLYKTCNSKYPCYALLEDEINDKYSNDDGRLVFEFDFLKFINNDNFASCELNRYLREKGVKIRESFISYMEYGLIFLDSPASKYCIAKALKISDDAIVDVSTLYGGDDELTHVIILDRCKEE